MDQENVAEVEQIIQKNSVLKSKCATPAPKFPELRTKHKMPVILVYPKPDFTGNIFLCSRTVADNLQELNQHYDNLMVYDDFIRYLAEPSGLEYTPSEQACKLIQTKESKVIQFQHHISEQKKGIAEMSNSLQELYTGKCQELVSTLQNVLEQQKDVFDENYTCFENEVNADKEKDADIEKFSEIKNKVSEMSDPEEIEKYFREVLRKKQSWEKASLQLRSLGKRSEDYYRGLVEEHYQNKPTFVQTDLIIEQWKKGLDSLISDVISQNVQISTASCFNGLFNSKDGIKIDISNTGELQLLTKAMVKETTELNINFEKKTIDSEEADEIAASFKNVSNLSNLSINFDGNQISNECLQKVLEGASELTELKQFTLRVFGNKLKDDCGQVIGAFLIQVTKLQKLSLILEFNEICDKGVEGLVEGISVLTDLKDLDLNLKNNTIGENGAEKLGLCLEKLVELKVLNLNLGGYSQVQNKIREAGTTNIARAISKLIKLETLILDLGFTGMTDASTIELSASIKALNNVQKIDIGLYNNDIHAIGSTKLVRALCKRPFLKEIHLNLNSNTKIKHEGATQIVADFRRMESLTKLELLMKQVGIQKDQGKGYKGDLLANKNGSSFTSLDISI